MDSSEQASKQFGKSRSTLTAAEFLNAISRAPNATTTCEKSEEKTSSGPTSSAEDSPAKTFPTPAVAQESMEIEADSGVSSSGSFANYVPASSSWRTSQLCLDGEWAEFSGTWPRSGTMRSGKVFEQPMLVPLIDVNESGLLPTPTDASKGGGSSRSGDRIDETPTLQGMARKGMLWPTPQAHDAKGCRGTNNLFTDGHYYPHDLTDAVKMWPTPKAIDGDRTSMGVRGRHDAKTGRDSLKGRVWREMVPTPSSRDWKDTPGMAMVGPGGRDRTDQLARHVYSTQPESEDGEDLAARIGGQLNPTWVEWLMGYPLEWTDLKDSATPSSRKSRKKSAGK